MLFARRSGPSVGTRRAIPVDGGNLRAKTAGDVQPMDALLEKRVAARKRFVVAPIVRGFEALGDGREVRKNHVADDAVGERACRRRTASGL